MERRTGEKVAPFTPFTESDFLCLADYVELLYALANRHGHEGPFVTSENKGCATRPEALELVGLTPDTRQEDVNVAFRSWLYWYELLGINEEGTPFSDIAVGSEDYASIAKISGLAKILDFYNRTTNPLLVSVAFRIALAHPIISGISIELKTLLEYTVSNNHFCKDHIKLLENPSANFHEFSRSLAEVLKENLFKDRISQRALQIFAAEITKMIFIMKRNQTFYHMRAISCVYQQRPLKLPAA